MATVRIRQHLTKKQRSKRSEKETAKFFKGRVQPASGAMRVAKLKGDVIAKNYLIDDKITISGAYTVNLKFWRKLNAEAMALDKHPVVRVEFEGRATVYVIDEQSMARLLA